MYSKTRIIRIIRYKYKNRHTYLYDIINVSEIDLNLQKNGVYDEMSLDINEKKRNFSMMMLKVCCQFIKLKKNRFLSLYHPPRIITDGLKILSTDFSFQ